MMRFRNSCVVGGALMTAFLLIADLHPSNAAEEEGIFAEIHTSKGTIAAKLFYKRAPMTVMNFIGLAEGTIAWRHPTDGAIKGVPLYKKLTFHNVRDFMIQTGDPTGIGKGGSGQMFDDEFHPELTHAQPGVLSMANKGPNTNSSQFFITHKPTPWMDNHYTMFGKVIAGLETVKRIQLGDGLEKITIRRVGQEANSFNTERAHELAKANEQRIKEAMIKIVPDPETATDLSTLPASDQPLISPGSFEFIVIGHTEIKNVQNLRRTFYYDRKGAIELAGKLVKLARAKGANFGALVRKYSDMTFHSKAADVKDSHFAPAGLKQIFRLKPNQISDPIDLPTGVYVFRRLP